MGARILELGPRVQQWLQEVVPLRSQPMGRRDKATLFPLPASSSLLSESFPQLCPLGVSWLCNVCMGLNSLWGDGLTFEGEITGIVLDCLKLIVTDIQRVCSLTGKVDHFDWENFFTTRSIDYKGDEVKTAREFCWSNIAPALPKEIGRVPLSEVCTLGAKHYVENFDCYIRPPHRWERRRAPRVMVPDHAWAEVCQGLVSMGVCCFIKEADVWRD